MRSCDWSAGRGITSSAAPPLVSVWPGDRITDELADAGECRIRAGNQRTDAQDIEFAVHQLVEIAARALSPGVNDPFTAITCVDRLGSALCRLAQARPALAFSPTTSRTG